MPPERASISFISSYPCIGRSFSSESSARRTSPDSKKRRRQPHGSPSWPRPSKPPNHERQRPLPGPRLCILIQPALKAPPPHRAERPRGQQNTNANCYPLHARPPFWILFLWLRARALRPTPSVISYDISQQELCQLPKLPNELSVQAASAPRRNDTRPSAFLLW